ncbi:MAG: tetratricopeptide repeat protein [Planctomycetota bacterium]|nr:tetratricopeptide repeat protein [Planctomycetota bacterium]
MADVFREACQRGPAERSAFLDDACGGDAELRAQVEVLLAADETHPGFLAESRLGEGAARRAAGVLAPDSSDQPGHPQTIGKYRIIDVLGEGGMGVVYRAEQTEPMRRTVALKLIRLGMDSERVVARFDAERQALALMDHASVARVHDGGMTADGRPYFVMEYVSGIPITDYCDRERLSVAQRLALFLEVCRGVQHAHQKGIIHRDIKPSNVLVMTQDDQPVPRIIDFGVAKATAQRLTERTLFTEQGQLVGTPEYMSPEQAEMGRLNIDTRTDVYALGVLLYELLTGTLPFDSGTLRAAGFAEIHRIIRESEPPKPSTKLSTLRADREPAGPKSAATTTDGVIEETGIDGSSSSSAVLLIARNRRTDLRLLMRDVRGDLDWIVMKCLEKEVARRYASASELAADIERHLNHQPVEAGPPGAVYRVRKFVRRNRAGVTAATLVSTALLVGIAGTATGLVRAIHARDAEAETRRQLEQVTEFQASMLSTIDPAHMGRRIIADLRNRIRQGLGDDQSSGESVETALDSFDRLMTHVNGTDVALTIVDENVLAPAGEVIGQDFAGQPLVEAALRETVGRTYGDLGLYEQARPQLARALEIRQHHLGDDHPDTLTSVHRMGLLLSLTGAYDEAKTYYREALKDRRRVLGEDAPDTLISLHNLGALCTSTGRFEEAEIYLREALERRRRVLGDDDPATLSSLSYVGRVLKARGRLDEAEPYYREALEGHRQVLGDEDERTLSCLSDMGSLLRAMGRYEEALALFREAASGYRDVLGDNHRFTLIAIDNVGGALLSLERYGEAEQYLRQALHGRREALGNEHPDTLTTLNNLGHLLNKMNRPEEALPYLREAMTTYRESQSPHHPDALIAAHNLAGVLRSMGELTEAEGLYSEAVDLARASLGEDHWLTAVFLASYGNCLVEMNRYAEAEASFLDAYAVLEASLGPDHKRTRNVAKSIAAMHDAWHEADPQGGHDARADEWRTKIPNAEH